MAAFTSSAVTVLVADGNKLGDRAGGRGNALCSAVQLAGKLGDNKADGLSRAGGVGNDIECAGSCSSEVALSVRTVKKHLVAGVCMDGGHKAFFDGSKLVERVSHGSEAVGGAGRSGDDRIGGLKCLFVYAVNDGGKVVARGSGNDDLTCAGVDMSACLLPWKRRSRSIPEPRRRLSCPRGRLLASFSAYIVIVLAIHGNDSPLRP